METLFSNTIQKQTVEVSITGNVDGFAAQKQIERICKQQLAPQLEKLIDKYDLSDEIISIDSILVEIDDLMIDKLDPDLVQRIISKVEDEIVQRVIQPSGKESVSKLTQHEKTAESLIFYLKNGYFPWWANIKNSGDFNEKLNYLCKLDFTHHHKDEFIEVMKDDSSKQRFLKQIPTRYIEKLMDRVSGKSVFATYYRVMDLIQEPGLKPAFEKVFREAALQALVISALHDLDKFSDMLFVELKTGNKNFKPAFEKIIPDLLKIENLPEEIITILLGDEKLVGINSAESLKDESPPKEENEKRPAFPANETTETKFGEPAEEKSSTQEQNSNNEIYLGNAGLVIIAPFLPMFFNDLGLSEGCNLTQISKTVALLNFIASGNQDYEEFECVLPKVLCGIELKQVIEKVELDDTEKSKINDLLLSVIEHWTILKNTSIEGLRASFLQREGKLTFEKGQWNLHLNPQSFDVLLEHLPWNISMIKLPWMKSLLTVNWL